jgi:hypothetical protein
MEGVPKMLAIVLLTAAVLASIVMFILDGVHGLWYVWVYLKLLGVMFIIGLFFSIRWLAVHRWDRFIKPPR